MDYETILLKMKEKSEEFATYLTDLHNLNNEVTDKTAKLLKTITKFKGCDKRCTVCYNRPSTHAFVSCGHMHCENCAQRGLTRNKCFQCRSNVSGLLKIYQ